MVGRYIALVSILGMLTLSACFGESGGPEPPDSQPPEPTGIPWAMPGGNAARTGSSELWGPFTVPEVGTGPIVQWEYTIPPTEVSSWGVCSSPVVDVDGNSYVVSDLDVFSLDSLGLLRWQHSADNDLQGAGFFDAASSPLLLTDDLLVVANESSRVWAFNLDGLEQWTVDLSGGDGFQLTTLDNRLAIALGSKLFIVDMDGNVLNQAELETWVSPDVGIAAAHGSMLVALHDGRFAAYSSTGDHLWSYGAQVASLVTETQPAGYPNWDYCVATDGLWLIPTLRGMVALNRDGTNAWKFDVPNAEEHSLVTREPAIADDGTILLPVALDSVPNHGTVPLDQGMVYALNAQGNQMWTLTGADSLSGTLFSSVESVTVDGRGDIYLELDAVVAVLDASGNLFGGFNKSKSPNVRNTWGLALGPNRKMLIGYTRNWLVAHTPPPG